MLFIIFTTREAPDRYRVEGDKACALWVHAEYFGVFLTANGCHPRRGSDRGPPMGEAILTS